MAIWVARKIGRRVGRRIGRKVARRIMTGKKKKGGKGR